MGFVRKFTEQAFDALSDMAPASLRKAEEKNPWFVSDFIKHRLDVLKISLAEEKETMCKLLHMEIQAHAPKVISIVAAGNIPLVCWHDVVCCLAYGAAHPGKVRIEIKLSSRDDVLLPAFFERLFLLDNTFTEEMDIQFVKNLSPQTQAVLFTGGSLAQEYYTRTFPNTPLLLRTGRNSVALLSGNETDNQLEGLTEDCFLYFGLGCRNVSLLLVPEGYDFEPLVQQVQTRFGNLLNQHIGYSHAFRHARACRAMEEDVAKHSVPEAGVASAMGTASALKAFFVLEQNSDLSPPMGVLYYSTYQTVAQAAAFIEDHRQVIQCVAGTTEVPLAERNAPCFLILPMD